MVSGRAGLTQCLDAEGVRPAKVEVLHESFGHEGRGHVLTILLVDQDLEQQQQQHQQQR